MDLNLNKFPLNLRLWSKMIHQVIKSIKANQITKMQSKNITYIELNTVQRVREVTFNPNKEEFSCS